MHGIEQNSQHDNLSDCQETVSLIEAWARWCRTGCRYGRVTMSGIYRLYKAPSVYQKDQDICTQEHPDDRIMLCNRAWANLPGRYRLLIMFYYVKRYSAQKACVKSGIRFTDFDEIHQSAVKMIRNMINDSRILLTTM